MLLDCEAGLEHLSRRTAGRPDVLVCVTNRARMAAETVRRALGLYAELHGALPPRVDLVLNGFEPDEPWAREMAAPRGRRRGLFHRVLTVPSDAGRGRAGARGGGRCSSSTGATPALGPCRAGRLA